MKPKYVNGSHVSFASQTTSRMVSTSEPAIAAHGVLKRGCVQANNARHAALATHRVDRPRRQVDAGERRHEGADQDGEIDEDREPGARVALGERVERGGIRRPLVRVVHAEADRHRPGEEDVVDEPDQDGAEDRARDHLQRLDRLLAEHGRRLEADEAREGEDRREEEPVRRRQPRRVERLQRHARVAALAEDDEAEEQIAATLATAIASCVRVEMRISRKANAASTAISTQNQRNQPRWIDVWFVS